MAFLALRSYRIEFSNPTAAEIVSPILVAALPLADAALAVIRRLRAKVSPFAGDLGHLTDRLAARGLSPRQVAFTCYGITAILAALAWFTIKIQSKQIFSLSAATVAALIVVSIRLGSLRGGTQKTPAARPMRAEANEHSFRGIA